MSDKNIKTINNVLRQHKEVSFAYLFGSYAKGNVGPLSDIDIAVYFSRNIFRNDYFDLRIKIMGELIDMLKRNDVDFVVLNEAPPLLGHRILKEGKLIFCQDKKENLDYEVRAVLNYLDWKPYLEKYTKEVFSSI